ncbi:hypothetical protein HDU79_002391 [Rhizoclosmatium sp. JEL0117]|nr:hypothetical protein HDU79_002391 [Rhizoclosmatium sp. JEL0117]
MQQTSQQFDNSEAPIRWKDQNESTSTTFPLQVDTSTKAGDDLWRPPSSCCSLSPRSSYSSITSAPQSAAEHRNSCYSYPYPLPRQISVVSRKAEVMWLPSETAQLEVTLEDTSISAPIIAKSSTGGEIELNVSEMPQDNPETKRASLLSMASKLSDTDTITEANKDQHGRKKTFSSAKEAIGKLFGRKSQLSVQETK